MCVCVYHCMCVHACVCVCVWRGGGMFMCAFVFIPVVQLKEFFEEVLCINT